MGLMEKETIEVITRRVINSRNLETAISEVYKLFRRYLPLDFLNLPIYDSERGTLRYRAFANSQGVILTDETIRLSENSRLSTITESEGSGKDPQMPIPMTDSAPSNITRKTSNFLFTVFHLFL
ncbi:MAG TPA: hypothetical protein PLM29_12960, partial [Deltaproteobacteria bacterium]|nr:hypothetical protein [Deltaproteobacteria bacterium]